VRFALCLTENLHFYAKRFLILVADWLCFGASQNAPGRWGVSHPSDYFTGRIVPDHW